MQKPSPVAIETTSHFQVKPVTLNAASQPETNMQIRWARVGEESDLARVFYKSVREGPSPYTQAQREAWVPQPPDPEGFAARLASTDIAVAVDGQGIGVVGFMTLDGTGYIDLAFILHSYRGQGLFRGMFELLAIKAESAGVGQLRTHASLTAQPAFRALGFSVIQHETVTRAGETLRRAEMEKHLL